MAVEQKLEIDGEVTEALPNLLFRVKLENDHELLAHLAGKMRRFRIRVLPGDSVMLAGLNSDLVFDTRRRGLPARVFNAGSARRKNSDRTSLLVLLSVQRVDQF